MKNILARMKQQYGFTLIEMAVSMIIIGILFGAIAYPYSIWLKKHNHEVTVDHVERMSFSVGAFRSANGRYPCPAAMGLLRTDPNYGQPTDCTSAAVSPGTCSGGICVANSRRTLVNVDINSNNVIEGWEASHTPRVRIGAIPFRALNIPEDFTIDAYGNRIVYAVTEVQAADFPYNPDAGGISIEYRDTSNVLQSRVNPPHSAHFVVLSHGQNRAGGYTKAGVLYGVPCNTAAGEGENCDHLTGAPDPTFYADDYTLGANNRENDDVVLHQMPLNAPLWARSPENPSSIYAIFSSSANGNVGSDYAYNWLTSSDPNIFGANTRLWIRGNMLVDDIAGTGGETMANQFCNADGSGCFRADMIGGTGVACPSGAAFGVDNADMACTTTSISINCPPGQILQFIQDGTLICSYRPCRAETVTTCSQSVPLPDAFHGDTQTVYAGDFECFSETYTCTNGTWSSTASSGQCSCSAGVTTSSEACTPPATGAGITTETTQFCEFRNCYQTTNVIVDCSCPTGTSGIPPNCICNNGANNPPTCDTCPPGFTGTPPNCTQGTCANGNPNYPDCNSCANGNPLGWPNCDACANGEPGPYPNCTPSGTCANGNPLGWPNCDDCANGQPGPYPNCTPPSCDPMVECCNGYSNFPDCGPTCDPMIECCNGYSNFPICGPPACDPMVECCNGYSNFPTCGPCNPAVECCNGYSNFPTCGPPPCNPAIECCNGYSNFPICGPPGGPGNPPCMGGANPPPCNHRVTRHKKG